MSAVVKAVIGVGLMVASLASSTVEYSVGCSVDLKDAMLVV